jgi:ABC-type Fe3+ transport system substrate-binding protein
LTTKKFVWLAGTAPFHSALAERFGRDRPGTACEAHYLNGAQSVVSFRREKADVLSTGLDEAVPSLRKDGLLADLRGRSAWNSLPAEERDPRGAYVFFAGARSVIVYDPRRVKEAPRAYAELAAPQWRGTVALVDPTTCGFGVVFLRFAFAQPSLGPSWVRELGANRAVLRRQTSHVIEAVVRGESLVGFARDAECRAAKQAGAMIAWREADEGHLFQRFPSCLRVDAPNLETGGGFLDWLAEPRTRAFLEAEGCGMRPGKGAWISDPETPDRADTAGFAAKARGWFASP